ncbi:metabolite traffic protein EboE [Sulfuriroseicoccus oceanibius]|uniref:Metabolite traffic protein EboE n=1 Tax=Sulfuriroseicoccus oceanibius TaxID=2707525 RepID=A0A6B3LDS1_9BACT|nr:metabolite traffic protein EboE [Sulfuriroseicoccus oceanibius]QQL45075.1 metabolite traffic protein EboE [Sulfuriroseicoccus oceanibius]
MHTERPLIGYCTNIHPGESWADTFANLQTKVTAVRDGVQAQADAASAFPDPYPIGLRLGADATRELMADADKRAAFRDWCERERMLLYTVNGFPYGQFHGTRIKEQVYQPDWAADERVSYTLDLFKLLIELAPDDSPQLTVSTVPASFKPHISGLTDPESHILRIRENLQHCAKELEAMSEASGIDLVLGLEPEPLGLIENATEAVGFFELLTSGLDAADRARFLRRIGITFDTCHAAIEYENAGESLDAYQAAGIRIAKIHLSNAIAFAPGDEGAIESISRFVEPTYLHQVIARKEDGSLIRSLDLPHALTDESLVADEWRVHYHIPLYAEPERPLGNTLATVHETADWLRANPGAVRHFEMETYTFDVMPEGVRPASDIEMLVNEHLWCARDFLPRATGA